MTASRGLILISFVICLTSSINLFGDVQNISELLGPDFRLSIAEVRQLDEEAQGFINQGDSVRAVQALEKGLKITEETLGLNHRDVVNLLNSIADEYIDQGELDKAASLLQRSMEIGQKT